MKGLEEASLYGDRDALRRPSRPIAFNRQDDDAVFLACRQLIRESQVLLDQIPDPATRSLSSDSDKRLFEPILRLFYSSRASTSKGPQQTQKDIADIVRMSRERNPDSHVSGVLVANSKMYSQIIEGPFGSIKDLIGRISCDARHQDIKIISREASSRRLFPDWSIGFVLTELELDVQSGRGNDGNEDALSILSFCSSMGIKTI